MEKERLEPEVARSTSDAADAARRPVAPEPSADEVAWLKRLLDVVRERKGLDFSGYRLATLARRVRTRMIAAGAGTFADYLERLRRDAGEADALAGKLTIKVSRFFRDPGTFDALRGALQARREERPGRRLRVWSAGCGRGEEPYGLAILLDQLEPPADDADVLGTDIDSAALEAAARGCYPASSLEGLDPALRPRYFEERNGARGGAFCVREDVRGRVDLRQHDVVGSRTSPDGRRFDLVCCRNVLIYLEGPAQARAEALLAASLLPGGLLCLGEAEWLLPSVATDFDVVDRRARLFRLRERVGEGATA